VSDSPTQGGVNASIPLQARAPEQPNPLQTIGQFADTANALNRLKLFPGQQQQQQQAIQGTQVDLQTKWNRATAQAMSPLLTLPPGGINESNTTSLIGPLEPLGVHTGGVIGLIMKYKDALGGWDPAVRAVTQALTQAPENAVGAVTPTPSLADVGPGLQPLLTPPRGSATQGQTVPVGGIIPKGIGPQFVGTGGGNVPTNAGQPTGGVIPNTPSPAELNQFHQVWNPVTHQFDHVRNANVAPMVNGAGQPIQPGAASAPAVPGLPSSGRIIAPPTAAAVPASAPLGTEAGDVAATQHAQAARAKAGDYQATVFPINGAIEALSGADTGKGAELLNNIRGYLGDTPLKYVAGFLPSSLSDQAKRTLYDEASKYTTGMAIGGPGGSRSNEGQAASVAANPNVHISNTAALAVAKSVLAQRRMEQAGTLAFDRSGAPDAQYLRFMDRWNTDQDPHAFAADKMTADERAKLVASMGGTKSAAYQKFRRSFQEGVDSGVIERPGGG
jgi:hypothetical protein